MEFDGLKKVSWFPGHMLKAERQLRDKLSTVDLVVELVDSRAPNTTRNRRLGSIIANKATAIVLGKTDLADPNTTNDWLNWFRDRDLPCTTIHSKQRRKIPDLLDFLKETTRNDPRSRWGSRLAYKRPLRLVVIGLPNVGKSTLINTLVGHRRAKTGPKPGLTRSQQWVLLGNDIEMLDTPGIMVPDTISARNGLTLALLALVREEVVGPEIIAEFLHHVLLEQGLLQTFTCYDLAPLPETFDDFLEQAGRRLGMIHGGDTVDRFRTASRLIRDYQDGKLGRISIERPELAEPADTTDPEPES